MAKRRAPADVRSESRSSAAVGLAVLRAWWGWSGPRLGSLVRAIGRAVLALATTTWRRRSAVLAIAVRIAFWGALALWTTTAIDVVGGRPFDVELAVGRFGVGALACAFAVLLAAARPVRWASWALGSLHGASATVLWLLVNG